MTTFELHTTERLH